MTTEQKSPLSKGPYISMDYDELYFPVEFWTYNKVRTEAAMWAEDLSDSRSRYVGKTWAPLHNHDDWEYCEECPEVLVWHFEIYEGTPR